MILVVRDCSQCLEPGEAQRVPRDPAMPLLGYTARCQCGWRTLVRTGVAEAGGRASFKAACQRCAAPLEVDADLPGVPKTGCCDG